MFDTLVCVLILDVSTTSIPFSMQHICPLALESKNEKLSKAYSPDDACKSSRACDYLVFSSRSQVVNQSLLLSVLVFLPHAQHIYPAHISQKSCFHRRRMCRFAFSPLLPVFILCLNAFQKPPATRLAKMVTKAFLLKLHGDCLST